jgi:hypothetical protein
VRVAWFHVAALWAIAVAQPLFDLLGANPEFFIAHRAARAEILLLTLALAVLLPSVLALIVWLIGLIRPATGTAALGVVVGGLSCLLVMQLAVRAGAATWVVAIPISVVAGAVVAVAHHRLGPVRTFCSVLSVAALVTPGLFLLKPGIRTLVAGQASNAGNHETPAAARGTSIATPVVLVIFDELPLLSLLDADRHIDPLHYPNFSALAHDGVWFRNATTVSDFTRWAVPAIASGKYPRHSALPSTVDHPHTLFTLLSRTHRLEVSEPLTDLCPPTLCPADTETSLGRRVAAISQDLAVIYLHTILTGDLTAGLPDPTATWAGFGGGGDASALAAAGGQARADNPNDFAAGADDDIQPAAADEARRRWRHGMEASRVTPVRQFIERIGADDPQPTFYFLHTLISHYPHHMLPNGRQNGTFATVPAKFGGSWRKDQAWAVAQQYQRHLLQAGFVDRLLGQLVERLKNVGLYDRALIVITADHGISFTPGAPQRNFAGQNAAEIMRVPLVIKFPERIRVLQRVSDVNAETVDILPTIADALTLDVTWPIDGTSLLDPVRPKPRSKAMFPATTGRRRDVEASGPDIGPALLRKLALFGDGTRNVQRAPRVRAFDEVIGRPVGELRVVDGGGPVEILHAWEYDDVDPAASAAVFDVAGRFGSPRPDTFVAVAINGQVEAVTRTWESNPRGWLATPRFDAWKRGRNAIGVFVIERDDRGVLLRRTSVRQVRPADLNLILNAAASDWGVRQWGFHPVEGQAGGNQFRWTRERAELSNLFTHNPPRAVEIGAIMVPGGKPKPLKIEANDCTLFEGIVHRGWSAMLSLERCDLSGVGLTLRFTTDAPRGADRRRLGIAMSRVVLR